MNWDDQWWPSALVYFSANCMPLASFDANVKREIVTTCTICNKMIHPVERIKYCLDNLSRALSYSWTLVP